MKHPKPLTFLSFQDLSKNCQVGFCSLGAWDNLPWEELVNDLIVKECGPIRGKINK